MGEELRSVLLGTAGLSAALVLALILTFTGGPVTASRGERLAASRVVVAAIIIQFAHFSEEYATGFHRRFPEQFGLAPWSSSFFVLFNLFWLIVWALSAWGLRSGRRAALAALWFLGIAAVVNGVAHPALAIRAGGYFPGLMTSPLLGVVGVLLLRQLSLLIRKREVVRGTV